MRNTAVSLFILLICAPLTKVFAGDSSPAEKDVTGTELGSAQERTLEELKEKFSLFPYDQAIRRSLINAYAAMGEKQLKGKRFDEAVENFENARRLSPDNQDLGVLKGIALYGGKRYDEAALELERARRNGGDTFHILFYLGRTYYDTGDLANAVELWDLALTMDPGNKPLRDMAAKAHREMKVESRMDRGYGSMFVISYNEGTRPDLADAVLDVLAGAYNRVGYDLSHYPGAHIPVILYTSKDYREVTSGPDWSGGMYDGKVRLPIGGATEVAPMLRGVLVHEYTHVVVGELTKGNCPVWLNEGLAEYEGRKEFDTPSAALEKAAKAGTLIPFRTLEKSFSSLDTVKAALAYQQSQSMVSFMISSYGMYKVREVLVNLGNGMEIGAAVARAFADYRLDFEGILKEWRKDLLKSCGAD